jgi:hypothetical protein
MGQAILRLMPVDKGARRSFLFANVTERRLARLSDILEHSKSDTAIIEDALAHFLWTLEAGQPVKMVRPAESLNGHKRPDDAS